jgi:hypothetical protein
VRVVKRFSHVTAMEFHLSEADLYDLLHKAGKIPQGFLLDCDNPEETKFPISLHVKQVISQDTGGSQP